MSEVDERVGIKYSVDQEFHNLMLRIKDSSKEEIVLNMLEGFRRLPVTDQVFLQYYYDRYNFWGCLSDERGNYEILSNRAEVLHDHWEDFLWLFNRLSDYRSKYILLTIVKNWYGYDSLEHIKEKLFFDYFDPDIMKCGKNEVIVDLGAYTGDSIFDYVNTYGRFNYKKIYCYEITPHVFEALKINLRSFPDIVLKKKGASDESGVLYISECIDISSNTLGEQGGEAVEVVTIDEDIEEPVSFIKMDIEGSEQKALLGCKRQIAANKPKLAISVYHNNEDLFKIPRMVDEICEGYQFYLRYHGGRLSTSEISLLAVHQ